LKSYLRGSDILGFLKLSRTPNIDPLAVMLPPFQTASPLECLTAVNPRR